MTCSGKTAIYIIAKLDYYKNWELRKKSYLNSRFLAKQRLTHEKVSVEKILTCTNLALNKTWLPLECPKKMISVPSLLFYCFHSSLFQCTYIIISQLSLQALQQVWKTWRVYYWVKLTHMWKAHMKVKANGPPPVAMTEPSVVVLLHWGSKQLFNSIIKMAMASSGKLR